MENLGVRFGDPICLSPTLSSISQKNTVCFICGKPYQDLYIYDWCSSYKNVWHGIVTQTSCQPSKRNALMNQHAAAHPF